MSRSVSPKILTPRIQLRQAREQAGWSQIEVAERVGTGQVTVSRWETGESAPSPYFRKKLSSLFGRAPEELDLATRGPAGRREEAIVDPLIPPLPRTPLIGREQELASLRAQLCAGENVTVAMSGLPGVGKTTLACTLAQDREIRNAFPDGVLWIGLGLHPDLQRHLLHWGTLLGLTRTQLEALSTGSHEKDLVLAVRGAIGTRRMLLILDDVWTIEDALACQVVGGSQCAILITTRFLTLATTLGGNSLILHELTTDQSLTLLSLLAPRVVEQEEPKMLPLVQAVGGLPLALTLMGNYLRLQGASGQTRRVQTALDQLHSVEARFALSEPRSLIDPHPSLPDEQPLSLNAVIAVTDQQLPASARTALYALSVLPAKPESFSEEVALAVTACSLGAINTLLDIGILEAVSNERYTMHQTIRDYARLHLATPHPQERLIAYALTFLERHAHDYEMLAQERSTLLHALEAAFVLGKQRELIQGVCVLVPFLVMHGNYELSQRHLLRAQQAAQALHDHAHMMTILLHLGNLAGRQGDYAQSQDFLEQGLIYARREGDVDHLCALLSLLGRSLWKRGRYTLATTTLHEGLLLARQMGSPQRICELLDMIGAVAERTGDYAQAEASYREGLALARQIADREEICRMTAGLGILLGVFGAASEAEALVQEGLSIAQQIGYREWTCVLLLNLGEIVRSLYQAYTQAEEYLQEALQLAHQIEQREWTCVALVNLTELEIEREHYQQARVYLEESAMEALTLGIPRLSVYVLLFRSVLTGVEGQYAEAEASLCDMQRLLPQGDRELQALWHYGQAQLAARRGHLQQARHLGEMSAGILEGMGHYQALKIRRWGETLSPVAQDEVES